MVFDIWLENDAVVLVHCDWKILEDLRRKKRVEFASQQVQHVHT